MPEEVCARDLDGHGLGFDVVGVVDWLSHWRHPYRSTRSEFQRCDYMDGGHSDHGRVAIWSAMVDIKTTEGYVAYMIRNGLGWRQNEPL